MTDRDDRVRVEKRRYGRAPVSSAASFAIKGDPARRQGICKDISVGGMFLVTESPAAFGAEVVIHATLPGSNEPLALPGVVRWLGDGGMGVQFGLLGAVETHLITELQRKHAAG
jgi:type IV pilus assembly protein PilZ